MSLATRLDVRCTPGNLNLKGSEAKKRTAEKIIHWESRGGSDDIL